MDPPASLIVDRLEKKFSRGMKIVSALKGVSLKLEANSVSVLYGPNGAGKTTLLRCLVGSAAPNGGSVSTTAEGRVVGYVPEGGRGVHGELTARQNITWARLAHGVADASGEAECPAYLRDLWELDKPASRLSRGQRQLLSIAVALTGCPPFLLLDEPFNGLDPPSYSAMMTVLRDQADQGTGILISSHDLRLSHWADKLYFMKAGRIVQTLDRETGHQNLLCVVDVPPALQQEFLESAPDFEARGAGEAEIRGSATEICMALSRAKAHLVTNIRVNECGLESLYYG